MAEVLAMLAAEVGVALPASEGDALGRSLPGWPVFEEVPAALAGARRRGWRLVALTNSDRDLIDASLRSIGVPFERATSCRTVGLGVGGELFDDRASSTRLDTHLAAHVHVAESHFHDIVPASELGIGCVWINRLGEQGEPALTRELLGLGGLADVLDELVPAG